MNSLKTGEMNEKSRKNNGGMLTQLFLSHLLFALTIYQINAISLVLYSMVRYADYLIYIFINIYGNIRNERKSWKKGDKPTKLPISQLLISLV